VIKIGSNMFMSGQYGLVTLAESIDVPQTREGGTCGGLVKH
jgi:hypothetical protein